MNRFFLGSLLFVLAGCSSTQKWGADLTPGPSFKNGGYDVTADLNTHVDQGFFTATVRQQLKVYVDNELVVSGPLHENGSGELVGAYSGKQVLVDCIKPHLFSPVECVVHVDKKKLGLLKFKLGMRS